MTCYNPNCPRFTSTDMPDDRPYTAFCSKECHEAYSEAPAPQEDQPHHKHTITEVQQMLLEKAKSAPHEEDPVAEATEAFSQPTPQPQPQPIQLPYADD